MNFDVLIKKSEYQVLIKLWRGFIRIDVIRDQLIHLTNKIIIMAFTSWFFFVVGEAPMKIKAIDELF